MKLIFVLSLITHMVFSERTCRVNLEKGGIVNIHGEGFRSVPFSEKCFTTLLKPCEGANQDSQVQVNKATLVAYNLFNGVVTKTSPTGQAIFKSVLFDTEWNVEKRTFKIIWKKDNTKLCGLCNEFQPKNTTQFEECRP